MRPLGGDGQDDRRVAEREVPPAAPPRATGADVVRGARARAASRRSGRARRAGSGRCPPSRPPVREHAARAPRGERDEHRDPAVSSPAGLRMALVDHVEDRRHLRDARHRGRRVLDVVEQIDTSPAGGASGATSARRAPASAGCESGRARVRARRRAPRARPRATGDASWPANTTSSRSGAHSKSAGTSRRTYSSPPPVSRGTRCSALRPTRTR